MIEIASSALRARIDPFGAELCALADAEGRSLLTNGDPAFWTGRAPLLFPIVGGLNGGRYRLDGREYLLPRHGFARRMAWQPVVEKASCAVLRLEDTPETRAAWPFAFTLDADYSLAGATLTIAALLTNRDARAMPASFGFHPGFAWPLPWGAAREAHVVRFARPEPAPVRRLDGDGLVDPEPRPSPVEGNMLRLDDTLFAEDALIWDRLESGALRYGPPAGQGLEIRFDGAPMLGIWTKPGAPFLCIEPWWGIADPAGFTGALTAKTGMLLLAPGETRRFAMTVTLA